MKIGSLILALVLIFGATFYVLGSLATEAARVQAELREIQARNQQLEAQLQQQNQICQRDVQVLDQRAQQLQEQIRSQREELALLQQSLDAERAARLEAEQAVETLKVQRVDQLQPPPTQNKSIWSLATPTTEHMRNWAKAILTSSLIVLVLIGGYSARNNGKATLHRPLRCLNRTETIAVEPNLVWVRMPRQQWQEYCKWRRGNYGEQYRTSSS